MTIHTISPSSHTQIPAIAAAAADSLPRKRSKVSRACDECRRKKIRCDATLDGVPKQCSSCRRADEKCSFSRIPMKRGPSKGYIKDLEDRLNSLENSMSDNSMRRSASAALDPLFHNNNNNNNNGSHHKGSVSSTGSTTYPSDSPGSTYNYYYPSAGSPRLSVPPDQPQPRPRAGSIHSLPAPIQSATVTSPSPLDPVAPGPSGFGRKRAFSSTIEYQPTHSQQQPSQQHLLPLKLPLNIHQDRLPSIDSFHSGTDSQQLPPLVTDELQQPPPPPPPFMPPPNANHYWKSQYDPALPGSTRNSYQPPQPPQPPQPSHEAHSPRAPTLSPAPQLTSASALALAPTPATATATATAPHQQLAPRQSIYHRQPISGEFGPNALPKVLTTDSSLPFTWDEDVVDIYFTEIHPILPILDHSRAKLRARLVATTAPVRNALLNALYGLVRFRSLDVQKSVQCLAEVQRESYDKLSSSSLILIIQTMLLLALETSNHGTVSLEYGVRSMSYWIGAAVGLTRSLRHMPHGNDNSNDDNDSNLKLSRRLFVVLTVLDRWYSAATMSPMMTPDHAIQLTSEDRILLGSPAAWAFVRLALVLGHVIESCWLFDEAMSVARLDYLGSVLRGELDRVRESIEELWHQNPILEITYLHIKLFTLRVLYCPDPQVLLKPASRMASFLSDGKNSNHSCAGLRVLGHHFWALASSTLLYLTQAQEFKNEAWHGLQVLEESQVRNQDKWQVRIRHVIETQRSLSDTQASSGAAASTVNSESIAQPAGSSSGLEKLAAIAVGQSAAELGSRKQVNETAKDRRLGYLDYFAL
ncbi:hypothetical protein V1514DRAFT_327793 [Lipomyces japonicus]|uniref:uncharacterized protein n=1 Tax=Lipomyces japonicus TaxID=56871 RepID=UPI0034CD21D6